MVLEKPAPRVVIDKFTPDYMEMKVRFWVQRKPTLHIGLVAELFIAIQRLSGMPMSKWLKTTDLSIQYVRSDSQNYLSLQNRG